MACARCGTTHQLQKSGWCSECERAYDTWVRRHAADIIWATMGGGTIIALLGVGLPLLGLSSLIAASAAFAGSGTVLGIWRGIQRRRRRQFLSGGDLPRAYLPVSK